MRIEKLLRPAGLIVVAAGLIFQIVEPHRPRAVPLVVAAAAVVLGLVSLAPRRGRCLVIVRWVMAVLLALDFAGAVADRFGVLGEPGAAGVTWGDWDHFVDYTEQLLPWAPHPLAVAAALGATAVESVLSVWLLSGWRRRAAGVVAAGLLSVFLASMLPTVGAVKVAMNAVPLLVGGALLLAAQPVDSDPGYCAGRSSHTVA
ncbi:hypothetical protein GCM10010464_08860 [Pseudonocardia yunnanensis]|uniref:Uncharacterized protein n=1 Tax=Pseudonocardia yunnanensis TaxID=58107 RepID=A0ABW4F8Y7_9PSEU